MNLSRPTNFIALLLLFLFYGCAEEVDFDQSDDILLAPVVEMSLVYFDQPASSFNNFGAGIDVLQDFITIEFFNDKFIVENLNRLELTFQTFNSINRPFEMRIDFLDINNQSQYGFLIVENASVNNEDEVTEEVVVIEGDQLDQIKNSTQILFTLSMLPGVPINENTLGRLFLKSAAGLYFNIEKN